MLTDADLEGTGVGVAPGLRALLEVRDQLAPTHKGIVWGDRDTSFIAAQLSWKTRLKSPPWKS